MIVIFGWVQKKAAGGRSSSYRQIIITFNGTAGVAHIITLFDNLTLTDGVRNRK